MDNKYKGTVVFYSMAAIGHINPIISIVKELQRRGYRAIILTSGPLSIAPKLRAMGLEVEHCDNSIESDSNVSSQEKLNSMIEPVIEKFRLGTKDAFAATYKIGGVVDKYLKNVIGEHDILEAKLRSMKLDLVVVDHVVGVPCVTQVPRRWVRLYSGFPSIIYSSLNDNFVAGLGLKLSEMTPEMKLFEQETRSSLIEASREFLVEKGCELRENKIELALTSPHLNFYLGPQELDLANVPTLKPLPEHWFRLEHTIDEPEGGVEFKVPENLRNLPGKLIYFSLGTLINLDIELINRLLEIFSRSSNKFIVSMGQRYKHIKLYPNMWGDEFINQKAVLPKVDLFITHGGHNSIIEAFYYGVPGLIVLPVFADQFDCAQRVSDCGYGVRLNPYECRPEELLGAIDRLLADEKLKETMKNIGLRLRSIKYHEIAADKLEQLMRD